MILYDYYRSSASYRVRIALNLKALSYQSHTVNLIDSEQCSAIHESRNPQQLVPVLIDNNASFTQSMAICEYLDEAYPDSYPLLVGDAKQRCKLRAFSQAIACEVHPVNNLRILHYLKDQLSVSDLEKKQWYQHWVNKTFRALESQLQTRAEPTDFCFSKEPSLADVCLIPQIYNARRFEVNMQLYPSLLDIENRCLTLDAFKKSHPDNC